MGLKKTAKAKALVHNFRRSTTATRERHRGIDMYQPEIVSEIINRIYDGESLSSVCDDPKMPSWETVHKWMREKKDGFSEAIEQARFARLDRLVDEVVDIADAGADNVPHAKNQIETRFRQVAAFEASMEKANRPRDPRVVEAAKDNNGGWKVLENGETANPISNAIQEFMKQHKTVTSKAE